MRTAKGTGASGRVVLGKGSCGRAIVGREAFGRAGGKTVNSGVSDVTPVHGEIPRVCEPLI